MEADGAEDLVIVDLETQRYKEELVVRVYPDSIT